MKRFLVRSLLLCLLAALGVAAYAWRRASSYLDAPLGEGAARMVTIPEGASFRGAVAALAKAEVVRDPLVFEWYGRYRGVGRNIKAGLYSVDMRLTPRQLLDQLEAGSLPRHVRLTLPEGYNRWQVADRIAAALEMDRAALLARIARDDLEGRLFPDTYFLRRDVSVDGVLDTLTRRFDQVFAQVIAGHPEAGRLAQDRAARRRLITLASLVEKEARTQRDRGLVSRVFHNRLAQKMRLQTDPTCVYGPDLYKKRAHPRYCKDPKSAYSTYVIDGLPPTPIANPGRAALDAALRPNDDPESRELLYFVAKRDGSGEHVFSRTYAEHRAAVDRYLRGKR